MNHPARLALTGSMSRILKMIADSDPRWCSFTYGTGFHRSSALALCARGLVERKNFDGHEWWHLTDAGRRELS